VNESVEIGTCDSAMKRDTAGGTSAAKFQFTSVIRTASIGSSTRAARFLRRLQRGQYTRPHAFQ
jgi:hypothetical protein